MAYKSILDPKNISKTDTERCIELTASLNRGSPGSPGKNHLNRYFRGEALSLKAAVIAKCCDCSGYYLDGKTDCAVHTCPLYSFMPYGKLRSTRNKIVDPTI